MSRTLFTSKTVSLRSISPASILDTSRRSSMISTRNCPLSWISLAYSRYRSEPTGPKSSILIASAKPMMAFSGVRSSWLMFARSRVLAVLANSARCSASILSLLEVCSASAMALKEAWSSRNSDGARRDTSETRAVSSPAAMRRAASTTDCNGRVMYPDRSQLATAAKASPSAMIASPDRHMTSTLCSTSANGWAVMTPQPGPSTHVKPAIIISAKAGDQKTDAPVSRPSMPRTGGNSERSWRSRRKGVFGCASTLPVWSRMTACPRSPKAMLSANSTK